VSADFLSARELATRLGVRTTETLDSWVATGRFPPPWSQLGPRLRVWRRDHYDAFVATGEWPTEAWKAAG
jgi:predicted DNA-binding transcriptional regulator AlpA